MKLHRLISNGMVLVGAAILCACGTAKKATDMAKPQTEEAKPADVPALSDTEQERFNYFYLEAQVQQQKGENDAAFELLQHCVQIDPNAAEAWFGLWKYYYLLKDVDAAQTCLTKAVRLSPQNYWYKQQLAEFYLNQREMEKATAVYEEMVRQFPTRNDALLYLIDLYKYAQEYDKAIEALNKLELEEGNNDQISDAKMELYMASGNQKKAFEEAKSLIKENPNDPRYKLALGKLYLINEKYDDALSVFRDVQETDPDDPVLALSLISYYQTTEQDSLYHLQMDKLLVNQNADLKMRAEVMQQYIMECEKGTLDSTVVIDRFKRATDMPQDDATMLKLYANYMQQKGYPDDSLKPVLEKILTKEPEEVVARALLINYYGRREEFKKVVELCRAGTQYNPDELAFYNNESIGLFKLGDTDGALAACERGLPAAASGRTAGDPDVLSRFYNLIGDLFYEKGRKAEAYAMYDSCLVYKYDNTSCLNNYAYYLALDKKELEKAEEMGHLAIKEEPENKTFLDTYAWVLFVQKRYNEAKTYIDKVVPPDSLAALQPTQDVSGGVVEHAGDIYYMLGRKDEAMQYWKKALSMGDASEALTRKIRLKKYIE